MACKEINTGIFNITAAQANVHALLQAGNCGMTDWRTSQASYDLNASSVRSAALISRSRRDCVRIVVML